MLSLLGGATIVVVSRLRVKIGVKETGWEALGWINPTQDRDQLLAVVNEVMNLQVPRNFASLLTIWKNVNFSIMARFHEVRENYG